MENAGYDFGYQQPPVPDPYYLQDPCTSVLYTLSKQTEQTPCSLPICRPGRGFYSCNEWSGSVCVFNWHWIREVLQWLDYIYLDFENVDIYGRSVTPPETTFSAERSNVPWPSLDSNFLSINRRSRVLTEI